ncbi:hypothetical protein SAMN05444920_104310 [Nonomuraea solani]|uniref:Uncharacterized protein n=1 Tax=Nonomuraea solani TaxID=1144553 RepID=A0A1H6CSH8_9ACTN|nr:hypothetical protein [Nonomuraea solani]SEG75613.1 hypothetical protein SAMN05444920_104310 [Nonomuraea solani]
MNVRRLLPCTALAATALYAAVNLIALQVIAQPTGRLDPWFEEPWSDWTLGRLNEGVTNARNVTLCLTLILTAAATLPIALDRGSLIRSAVPTGVSFIMYELALVVSVLAAPTSRFWLLNDDNGLETITPEWYFPALITVCVLAFIGMLAWMTVPGPRGPSPM